MIKRRSPQTAHELFWEHNNNPDIYTYDPTDDGPECDAGPATKAILASHTLEELKAEREWYLWESGMLDQVVSTIRKETTTEKERTTLLLAARISVFSERLRLRGLSL